ncbi:RNA polymerase subunit sigma [Bacillus anthracis]|nr:RNA polymerase subunit sigma [Bacillus anthracis]
MTVDYINPSLEEYKKLVRLNAKLAGEIKLAETFAEDENLEELKREKKLIGIRIKIIEASFVLKHKWAKEKATA